MTPSSNSVFVDTSGWLALADRGQPGHARISALFREPRRASKNWVMTNYVLLELIAILTVRTRIPRIRNLAFIRGIGDSPSVETVFVDPELDLAGWHLLMNRGDKLWSLTDAVSFVLMERLGIRETLTHDRHFEQAGFVKML